MVNRTWTKSMDPITADLGRILDTHSTAVEVAFGMGTAFDTGTVFDMETAFDMEMVDTYKGPEGIRMDTAGSTEAVVVGNTREDMATQNS